MIHAWEKYGLRKAQIYFLTKYDHKIRSPYSRKPSFKYVLKGKVEYIGMIRGRKNYLYIQLLKKLKKLDPNLVKKPIDELDILYEDFKKLRHVKDAKKRGYELEKILNRLLNHHPIVVFKPFRRNRNGEQIDGAFILDGWHYLVECKWRKKLSSQSEIDSLEAKIDRSGKQAMGFFLSIKGWSSEVIPLLKQSKGKQIILMNGEDLEAILSGSVDLLKLIQAKIAFLNQKTEPYLSVKDFKKSF